MKTFFDSSAYAKRFIEEKGSSIVEDICLQTSSLGLSIICIPEIISALNRQVRERNISQRDYKIVQRWMENTLSRKDERMKTSVTMGDSEGLGLKIATKRH